MAIINILDLSLSGFDFFSGSDESYLDQISDHDLASVKGGSTAACGMVLASLGVSIYYVGKRRGWWA